MRSLALVALLLASVLGSRGTTLAPSPAVTDSPANQGQASSPPQPAFALAPVTVPTGPATPSASPSPEKAAVSPASSTEPQNAPSPVTPPKEYNASPPVEEAPPDPTDEVPPPVAAPPVTVENPTPILPGTPALLPSVQAPAPSVVLKANPPAVSPPSVVKTNPPVASPPSVLKTNPPVGSPPSANNQPSRPVGSVPPYPPPASPPPANGVPPYPPSGSFPAISPSTSAVPPPTASPVIAPAPQRQADPPSRDYKNGKTVPPAKTYPPTNLKKHHVPHASPPKESTGQTAPVYKSPVTGSAPASSPLPHNTNMPSIPKNAPSVSHAQPSPPSVAPKLAPTGRSHAQGWKSNTNNVTNTSSTPSYPPPRAQGPEVSRAPRQTGTKSHSHHAPPPIPEVRPSLPVHPPSPSPASSRSPANRKKSHHISPTLPPIPPLPEPKAPSAHPIWTLPPPPPNSDCNSLSCPEPLTDPPAGAPCACVLPIRVGIRLSVDLYSFFPLVSDFAEEVASGVNMAQSQVRVMGANVAGDQPDKTMVLVDLVPMQVKFDNATAFSAFESLWSKKISLKPSAFGNYEILYVVYPGLPPSPPSGAEGVGDGAFGNNRNARAMKPLGVDVERPKRKVNGSLIAIAVLSTVIALIICCLAAWLLILRIRGPSDTAQGFPRTVLPKFSRSSGTGHTLLAGAGRYSSPSGPSGSLDSSIATYAGQAKTFKFAEIEKATNGFDDSKVLGEGGFGCVYQGTLEDGTTVAVKVLKRYDGQGEREFLAEVEMLGRLHHRNLVKLLGICIEENAKCLVYELIPNGSVESHLHGADRETAPLDWNSRMKIALGAARALAYLHEDSSPCVIHRDFKSSNILLEHDYTPKVSDFGLARTARGEGNQHISTRVMGTFGYVAPEYAMTGHLLVKSDVYSYGVVLLELLTGRKPVDMSQPAGQENLVAWARPLLTNVLSLRQAVDPLLGPNVPLDNVAKAAAIASMCVQPEVAHRPSMGEVVQALKLVCSEGDDCLASGRFSQELPMQTTTIYDATGMEAERVLISEIYGSTPVFTPAADPDSFRKQSSSGPLMTGKSMKFWQRLRNLSRGSMSEHGVSPDYETRSQYSGR